MEGGGGGGGGGGGRGDDVIELCIAGGLPGSVTRDKEVHLYLRGLAYPDNVQKQPSSQQPRCDIGGGLEVMIEVVVYSILPSDWPAGASIIAYTYQVLSDLL